MKSVKIKAWLITEVVVLIWMLWKAFNVIGDSPAFYFNAGDDDRTSFNRTWRLA